MNNGEFDNSDDNDDDEYNNNVGKQKGRSVCNVSFSNLDLGNLMNGWPGDPIEKQSFDFHFTAKRIIDTLIAVGFLPMTGNAVNTQR